MRIMQTTTLWYIHKTESFLENEKHGLFWNVRIQLDSPIQTYICQKTHQTKPKQFRPNVQTLNKISNSGRPQVETKIKPKTE